MSGDVLLGEGALGRFASFSPKDQGGHKGCAVDLFAFFFF